MAQSLDETHHRFLGCLLGGAVGDALGAPVEFMQRHGILARFGDDGITDYTAAYGRLGAITDDTQMTLFTAEGLLRSYVRGYEKGIVSHESMTARLLSQQGSEERWTPYAEMLQIMSAARQVTYPRHIMLDSGAFTAWNSGGRVSVDQVKRAYASVLEKADDLFDEIWLINLDVIPGKPGRDATPEEKAAAIAESDRNLIFVVRFVPKSASTSAGQGAFPYPWRTQDAQKRHKGLAISY